jgi:hypothetical protein
MIGLLAFLLDLDVPDRAVRVAEIMKLDRVAELVFVKVVMLHGPRSSVRRLGRSRAPPLRSSILPLGRVAVLEDVGKVNIL